MLPAFQATARRWACHEAHVAALWPLLRSDYAQLEAEDRAEARERARARGWGIS
jgi:hypothetical protein